MGEGARCASADCVSLVPGGHVAGSGGAGGAAHDPRARGGQRCTYSGRGGIGLCARVSCDDRKADLERQVARLAQWAAQAGHRVVRVESEIGSAMSGGRSRVKRLLADPDVTTVVVEHRDGLGRMNVELVEAALSAHGRRLVVLDDGEVEDDLVRDMLEILTLFRARLYGRRSARNRACKALEAGRAWLSSASRCGKSAGRSSLTARPASASVTG